LLNKNSEQQFENNLQIALRISKILVKVEPIFKKRNG